ncbi:aspartate/glutamate racemase family protein [Sporolactobacillus shoreae]|uniref:Aspartate/glutamate racemase family protein n=1 Tax=Sporolactobacillus shoreae TaxID=1465501 RepID=A0A4Z0GP21_9BACL|nr:aspartate/glutamate racemase family protein [Sporolactobacillus shoreae]TGA98923.1 aspartate/glutamate racemase family protein [Sporolactobacillus shoreae]
MKTIGLIGGLSWESTAEYYRYINTIVQKEMGGLHSAKCLTYSFDFEEIAALQRAGEWDKATDLMIHAATTLENSGADVLVICTNTMHKMASEVQGAVSIPLIHIADAAAKAIQKQGLTKVGLLGTKFTMEQNFYKNRLMTHGISTIIPEESDRQVIHDVIFGELCQGVCSPASKDKYLHIIDKLLSQGAEGIILGCTEIPLLISQQDCSAPIFDTTYLHAEAAATLALETVSC